MRSYFLQIEKQLYKVYAGAKETLHWDQDFCILEKKGTTHFVDTQGPEKKKRDADESLAVSIESSVR